MPVLHTATHANTPSASPPAHGGNLAYAEQVFGVPAAGWMDLSTGISPWGYPAENIPAEVWQRLPGPPDDLIRAAAGYYGAAPEHIIPIPGSQYAITRVPGTLAPARVAVPVLGYEEHRLHWQQAGHGIVVYRDFSHLQQLVMAQEVEHVVVINPNNPTAETIEPYLLGELCLALAGRGVLLIDEAFADVDPVNSCVSLTETFTDLWILRSVGKFFGLAGVRLGFLIGRSERFALAPQMAHGIELWGINHPAQWLGRTALTDVEWQAVQRERLRRAAKRVEAIWREFARGRFSIHNGGLFITLRGDRHVLYNMYHALGGRGIFLRWCQWPLDSGTRHSLSWLRCGMPDDDGARLSVALNEIHQRSSTE